MTMASIDALVGMGGVPAVPAAPARPEMPGLRKAAVFLAQMSKEEAGAILSKLRPREVESLTRELMRLGSVESEDVDGVMNEFHSLMTAQHFIGRGGVDFAREILAAGLGEEDGGLAQAGEFGTGGRRGRDGQVAPVDAHQLLDGGHRHDLLSLNQPRSMAATSSGRSLTMAEISPRTFCRSAASSSS